MGRHSIHNSIHNMLCSFAQTSYTFKGVGMYNIYLYPLTLKDSPGKLCVDPRLYDQYFDKLCRCVSCVVWEITG